MEDTLTPHDVFCAKLARMAITFDADYAGAAAFLSCEDPYQFNHRLQRGNMAGLKQKNMDANFKCTIVSGANDTKVLMLHVGKDPVCQAKANTIYLAFAPPTNPKSWEAFRNTLTNEQGLMEPFSNIMTSKLRGSINTFLDQELADHLKDADKLNLEEWSMDCYLIGYGFGGGIATAAASKMHLPECLNRTLVTFGAPVCGAGERLSQYVQSARRFSHKHDPISKLFRSVGKEYRHFGDEIKDDLSVTLYRPEKGHVLDKTDTLCKDAVCTVQYAGIDFRTKELAAMYDAMPENLVTMLFPKYGADAKNVWRKTARWSVLAHKQGETKCPWDV